MSAEETLGGTLAIEDHHEPMQGRVGVHFARLRPSRDDVQQPGDDVL
ncbi:hypothetical protein CAP2UW1_0741 [Candidatus Accumulibacter phosphatis]|uniref:Uncharacterized protein n=1 Tax=Accumulibacter regalis TaxID=522306 RepID=C7RMR0_ACCRE